MVSFQTLLLLVSLLLYKENTFYLALMIDQSHLSSAFSDVFGLHVAYYRPLYHTDFEGRYIIIGLLEVKSVSTALLYCS